MRYIQRFLRSRKTATFQKSQCRGNPRQRLAAEFRVIPTCTRLVYTLGHAREMRLPVLHRIIDILNLFRRGSRKFCQRGSNSATLTIYFFRGERIQILLKAGQHRPASKTPFNTCSSLALRITGSPDPLSPLWIRAAHDVEHPTYIGEGVSAGGRGSR